MPKSGARREEEERRGAAQSRESATTPRVPGRPSSGNSPSAQQGEFANIVFDRYIIYRSMVPEGEEGHFFIRTEAEVRSNFVLGVDNANEVMAANWREDHVRLRAARFDFFYSTTRITYHWFARLEKDMDQRRINNEMHTLNSFYESERRRLVAVAGTDEHAYAACVQAFKYRVLKAWVWVKNGDREQDLYQRSTTGAYRRGTPATVPDSSDHDPHGVELPARSQPAKDQGPLSGYLQMLEEDEISAPAKLRGKRQKAADGKLKVDGKKAAEAERRAKAAAATRGRGRSSSRGSSGERHRHPSYQPTTSGGISSASDTAVGKTRPAEPKETISSRSRNVPAPEGDTGQQPSGSGGGASQQPSGSGGVPSQQPSGSGGGGGGAGTTPAEVADMQLAVELLAIMRRVDTRTRNMQATQTGHSEKLERIGEVLVSVTEQVSHVQVQVVNELSGNIKITDYLPFKNMTAVSRFFYEFPELYDKRRNAMRNYMAAQVGTNNETYMTRSLIGVMDDLFKASCYWPSIGNMEEEQYWLHPELFTLVQDVGLNYVAKNMAVYDLVSRDADGNVTSTTRATYNHQKALAQALSNFTGKRGRYFMTLSATLVCNANVSSSTP
jgi:hypothetical protein